MKIIVADDEQLTRYTIVSVLKELNINDLEIVESVTGTEMIKRAEIFKPDGAFVDIRMPGLDGLSALEYLKNNYRDIYDSATWFILTGFADFEFARKAIEVGVENFLLKPVSKKEVKRAVDKIMILKSNREITSMRIRESELFSFAKEVSEVDDFIELSKYNFFRAWIVLVDYADDKPGNYTKRVIHHLHDIIKNLGNSDVVYTLAPFSDGHYYILESMKSKKGFSDGLKRFISEDDFFGESTYLTFVITDVCESMYSILSKIQKALDFSGNRHFVPFKPVRFIELGFLIKDSYIFFGQYCDNLASAFHLGAFKQVRDLLEKKPEIAINEIQNKILIENLRKIFSIKKHVTSVEEVFACIMSSLDPGDNIDDVPLLVSRTIEIVKTSYKETIGIIEISEMLGVTPNYLSSIFSRAMGIPLSRYITTFKLEEAKRLLLEDGATIKSVAYKVGYSSSKIFSRIFKKIYSISPSVYRKQNYQRQS